MLTGISEIIYKKQNSLGIPEYFELKILNDKNILKFNNSLMYTENGININNETLLYFLNNLFRIISDWKEKYIINNTLDSSSWSLIIEYESGKKEEYLGNSCPNNFSAFEDLIKEIIKSTGVI